MRSIAIVTGASSGVGREFVRQLDAGGAGPIDEIWLIARNQDKLAQIAVETTTVTRVFPLDLTDPAAYYTLGDALSDATDDGKLYVQLLVNSAGFGTAGTFAEVGADANAQMVRLNCLATVQMCSIVLPYLRPGSRIINLASMAGTLPLPGFATYSATKAFVLNFSRSLDEELSEVGIRVTAVCPKWMKTGFFDHLGPRSAYESMMVIGTEKPEAAVRKALVASTLGRPVCVPSPDMKAAYALLQIIPTALAMSSMRLLEICMPKKHVK